jgi:hypothetical protein
VSGFLNVLCEFIISLFIGPDSVCVLSVSDSECTPCLSDIFEWALTALQLVYTIMVIYVFRSSFKF